MIDGPSLVAELTRCGVTHVVWIPDTELGTWESALSAATDLRLLRVCREGEAFALAAGLHLGGQKPIVVIQCTGLFEAGDALRNVIHDMKLPIFFIVGVRSYYAQQKKATADTCPIFAEPIMSAWQIPYQVFDDRNTAADIAHAYRQSQDGKRAAAVLIAE
jgi:sulfopyruvate decarboxylase TPP-binding subunit